MPDSTNNAPAENSLVQIAPNEILQVKFFALSSTHCECGKTIEVVRLAVTREQKAILAPYCSDCAIEEAALLHENGYHSERGTGMALFNGDFVPVPR